jgi:hypothetical protein
VKHDKVHYENLNDEKYFNSWNRGFVAAARMHQTDLVLNEKYIPKNDDEKIVFKEMQIFMCAVLFLKSTSKKARKVVSESV